MKTKRFALLGVGILMAAWSVCAATNDASALLQKGLFEEEANRNLDAAIQAYQAVIAQTDKERKYAATALFRLAECYRKQGKTADATPLYERVVREFPEQAELVALSKEHVQGAGGGSAPPYYQWYKGSNAPAVNAGLAEPIASTDTEASEVKRIQALIKDSPDLISAIDPMTSRTPLQQAAFQGHVVVATFLLENGAQINTDNSQGTPLYLAADQGHKSMVELLLARGADVNKGRNNRAPLHAAAQKGFLSLAEVLLANHADVNGKTGAGITPLHLAVAMKNRAVAELLLAKGANPGIKAAENIYDFRNVNENQFGESRTALFSAAANGDREMAELLLNHGADVNARSSSGYSPLLVAAQENQVSVAELLLAKGADVNAQTIGYKRTALHYAVSNKSEAMLKLLLAHKPALELKNNDGYAPLAAAAETEFVPGAELLLSAGADVNAKGPNSVSPLLFAILKSSEPMLKLLLAHKPEIDPLDWEHKTPLARAVERNFAKGVELLLAAGANANFSEPSGARWGLLERAISNRNREIVELLLAHGADVNLQDGQGYTAIAVAKNYYAQTPPSDAKDSMGEIMALLRKAGADENLQRRSVIAASRDTANYVVFYKGTNQVNHFSAFELVAQWFSTHGAPNNLAFPDFRRLAISRLDASGRTNLLEINLSAALQDGDCAKDAPLQWGDVVEIPEVDHNVNESWSALPRSTQVALCKCLARKVTIIVKGEKHEVILSPGFLPRDDMLRLLGIQGQSPVVVVGFSLYGVLHGANVIRASSDLKRVKVKRVDPATKKTLEMSFNEENNSSSDLWLREGDVIEIPEKL